MMADCEIFKRPFSAVAMLPALVYIILFMPFIALAAKTTQPLPERHIERADSLAALDHYSEAIAELNTAFRLLGQNGDSGQQALLHNKMGYFLSMSGKETAAIIHLKKALLMTNKGNNHILQGDILNNLGLAYEYTGNLDSAFFYYSTSLQIREKDPDTSRVSASYRNVAQVLRVLGRFDEASIYCRKALLLIPGIRDYRITANIYNETAYLYELRQQPDSAALYYKSMINLSKANIFIRGMSVGYSNLASVYEQRGRFDQALELEKQGLSLDKMISDTYGMMTSYRTIAGTYVLMEQYENALTYLDSASRICDSAWITDLQGIEETKYKAYRGTGNYKQALFHFEASSILKDSVFNERKRKNIAEIFTRYETEKKIQKIELLNRTNELNEKKIRIHLLILVVVLLFSISGAAISMLIIHNKNLRLKQMHLELKNYMNLLDEDAKISNKLSLLETPIQNLMERFELTHREAEIMQLIGQGFTNTELGEKLFISANTIKYHIKNIYIKLDVCNRVQALKKTSIN